MLMETPQLIGSQEKAKFQYLKWTDKYLTEPPFEKYSIGEPISDAPTDGTNLHFEEEDILVRDIRGHEQDFSLDNNGFIVRNFGKAATALAAQQELGDAIIQKFYLPLVDEFLKAEVEGVDRVFPFDWRVRNAEVAPEANETTMCDILDREMVMKPANRAHIDHSAHGVPNMVRDMLSSDADFLLRGRVRVINVWIPLKHAVGDWPLAFCDGSSVSEDDDLVVVDFEQGTYKGHNVYLLNRDEHKWYFLRDQQPDEAFIFKLFDTSPMKATCCPHGSFRQNNIPQNTIPRMSIEVRTLVFTYPTENEAVSKL